MEKKIKLQELGELLQTPKNIVIIPHQNPDGDAIGSTLGLSHFLKTQNHNPIVICPNNIPNYIQWIPGVDEILIGEKNLEEANNLMLNADLIFCLDFSTISRCEPLNEMVIAAQKPIVLIDHHTFPQDFFTYAFYEEKASSTCELIYKFIEYYQKEDFITEKVATCLYTGLVTDTGSFKHSVTTQVFNIAAKLIDKGANSSFIQDQLFNHSSENRMRFIGYCLHKNLMVHPELKTAIISVTKEDQELFQIEDGDTEGLVNYALSIANVNMGIMLIDKGNLIKLSFRSFGAVPANHFAIQMGGGGHFNAAAARNYDSLINTQKKLLDLLSENKDLLFL